MIKYPYEFKNLSTDSKKYPYKCWQLDTGIPLFFSKIQYLLLYTIPLNTIMRVVQKLTNKASSASPLTTFNDFIEYISLLILGHDLDWSFSERHTF